MARGGRVLLVLLVMVALAGCEAGWGRARPTPTPKPRLIPALPPLAGLTPLATPAVPPTPISIIHTVKSGDTLFELAVKYGTTVEAIVAANSLDDPGRLQVGQRLIIPLGTPTPTPTPF